MACNPATLLAAASCFQCLSAGEVQLIRLALYCRIANGTTMACDIATLLNEASCFQCLPAGERQVAELALLCTIMTNGGGGGGGGGGSGGIASGAVDPVAAPSSPAVDNIYFNTVTKTEWLWPAGGAAWSQIV